MILFVNACMRGAEISRTYRLCKAFLQSCDFEEVNLTQNPPALLTVADVKHRDELIDEGWFDDPSLELARQFSVADEILVGAPYWDLSFPAALKSYIENIAVRNLTFKVTDAGTEGMCLAKKLTYITTAGGYISDGSQPNHGTDYFRDLCKFFGIAEFQSFCAEGLDIETNDAEDIMQQTLHKIGGHPKC